MRNAGLNEAQAGVEIARRKINNLRYADDTILMAESTQAGLEIAGRNIKNLIYAEDTTVRAESEE